MNTNYLSRSDYEPRESSNSVVSLTGLLTAALLCLSLLTSGRAQALEVPDFEQLVKDKGGAVVKISVSGKVQRSAPGFDGQQLPESLRRYFENLPQQPQPENRPAAGFGSGFIISDDGYIVTNAHVVDNATEITVALPDRREYVATLIGSDERSDIALLKVDATGLPTLTLGDSASVNVGQWVLAIGSPFGFEYTATQGIYMGVSFAIPVNVVKSVVAQLQDTGYVSRGWLGVLIQNVDKSLAESFGLDRPSGALVSKVTDGSPAAAAGVEQGDIILSFNGTRVERSSNLPPLVGLIPVGDAAELEVLRKGKKLVLPVTIAELEDDSARPIKTSANSLEDDSRLGLIVSDLTAAQKKELGNKGVIVEKIDPAGAAALAGIQVGDLLLSFNQTEVSSTEQLAELVADAPSDKPLAVLVQRNDSPLFSALTLN